MTDKDYVADSYLRVAALIEAFETGDSTGRNALLPRDIMDACGLVGALVAMLAAQSERYGHSPAVLVASMRAWVLAGMP